MKHIKKSKNQKIDEGTGPQPYNVVKYRSTTLQGQIVHIFNLTRLSKLCFRVFLLIVLNGG